MTLNVLSFPQWNDSELTREQWLATDGGAEPGKLHDGTKSLFDPTFAQQLLRRVISSMG